MTEIEHYDAVIIGSGQGGGPLSTALERAGRRTAIVEREHEGGTCINEGCTPTKTMVASARVAYLDRRSPDYGVHSGDVRVAMEEVRARKQRVVDEFREGSTGHVLECGVDLILGEARFTGPKAIEVSLVGGGVRRIAADIFVINAGCRPGVPPIPGLDAVPFLTSTTVMELDELPDHLVVIGGSYVGIEFGQMFRRFGSQVTIIQQGPRLMGREDADVADEVLKILREDGIRVILNANTRQVEQGTDGLTHVKVTTPDAVLDVAGSHVLVAAGRAPNTEALDLPAAGVETNPRGFVTVNERLETNVPGIYAIGDVNGGPMFTHISYDDFRILRANLLHGGNRSTSDRLVPYTMFMDPQLGRVGLSEEDARRKGLNIAVATKHMAGVARAIEVAETRGLVKIVLDADRGQILGGAALGIEGGEIMAMIEIAMLGKLHYSVLRDAIFAHPTLAELLNTIFDEIDVPDPRMRDMPNFAMVAAY
jgi:pyruvate/2-oxoglutarate dehydrogenase complex dihydrolipoamide dehydrogenase (E3) component